MTVAPIATWAEARRLLADAQAVPSPAVSLSGLSPRSLEILLPRLQAFLAPARVRELAPMIRAHAARLDEGTAHRLPVLVMATLLGIPERELPFLEPLMPPLLEAYRPGASPEASRRALLARRLLDAWMARHLEGRPRAPLADLLLEPAGLDPEDRTHCAVKLLTGGSTTVADTVRAGLPLLREQGGLRADRGTVEEMLRLRPPIPGIRRTLTGPWELGSQVLPEGTRVWIDLEACNRDPARFENPEAFDPSRSPNPHLTFGHGPRHCPGSALARLELEILLERLT